MLRQEDVAVAEEYGNQVAPYQYRITHTPTGVYVIGNTGSESGKPRLQADLLAKLEQSIGDWTPPKDKTIEDDIADLQKRLLELQGKSPEAKKRGRPAKATDEIHTAPEGYSVLDPSKVQAPPTVQIHENRVFKAPKTVSVSNVKGIEA